MISHSKKQSAPKTTRQMIKTELPTDSPAHRHANKNKIFFFISGSLQRLSVSKTNSIQEDEATVNCRLSDLYYYYY
jgi:hypothetical protein